MDSILQLTDDVISEDFQEAVLETSYDHLSLYSVRDEHPLSPCLENDDSNHEDQFDYNDLNDRNLLTDTISINSDDNSSGSSLHRFESQNETDTTPTDAEHVNIDNDEFNNRSFLQDIKAAIKVKWIDKSVFIQKSIQQHSQDSWGDFVTNLDLEKCLFIQTSYNNDPNELSICYAEDLTEPLYLASKSKHKVVHQEIDYSIVNTAKMSLIPQANEIKFQESLLLSKPPMLHSNQILYKSDPRKFLPELINTCKDNSISETIGNSTRVSDLDSRDTLIRRLHMELQNKNMILRSTQYNLANNSAANEKLHSLNLHLEETLKYVQGELHNCKIHIAQLEKENATIRHANHNLSDFKVNVDNILASEKQQRKNLQLKVESFSMMQSDYQWLCQIFADYQALCVDYDGVVGKKHELEAQLIEANNTIENCKAQMITLENKAKFYQKQADELQSNQNHCHEIQCSCMNHRKEYSCFHSKPKNSHNSHKKKSKEKSRSHEKPQVPYNAPGYNQPMDSVSINQSEVHNENIEKNANNIGMDVNELEHRYDSLQMKKRSLESELCHVPITNIVNRNGSRSTIRGEKEQIENELDAVDLELSQLRRMLKQAKLIRD